jgi:hypothetical protein
MTPLCARCDDTFWVCEAHDDVKSNGERTVLHQTRRHTFCLGSLASLDSFSLRILKETRE